MNSLLSNLNSDYIKAYLSIKPTSSKKEILVYVESYDDKAFWRNILKDFETESILFDIQTPSRSTLGLGKNKALERESDLIASISVGQYLIICVDSDFDYLLQNNTAISTKINQSPFIFQTYSYSYENLVCYSESLHSVCVQSTKCDQKPIDLVNLLDIYSKITYPLFLWCIYFRYQNNFSDFTLSDFLSVIKIINSVNVSDMGADAIGKLNTRVLDKIKELQDNFNSEVDKVLLLGEKLKSLGLREENTYLFIQGHTIMNNVVMMFLNPITSALRKKMRDEIKAKSKHPKELEAEMKHYDNSIVNVELVLSMNTDFKKCFLYKKIEHDLKNYLNGIL